jgi:hypothetical protein
VRLLFDQRAEELKEKIHHVGRESLHVDGGENIGG